MATSPLFGWEEPDDVDLVKDGAAAIRTLGNAIDTSMGDLLGGTTGQVLSKASNTNMDFTWVTTDDANAIQNAIVDAKGDLIAASAADTPARLAVGNNGETLVADSSTSTGLRYQAPATLNTIINGGMDVWQRGTSGTATASVYYTADRWYVYALTNSPFARSTSVPTGAGCQYSLEVTGATSGTDIYIGQRIESANVAPIKGTVTVSAYIYNETGASVTPTLRLDRPQAVDNYSSADTTSYTLQACANNAWTRVTQTVDISALSNIDNGLALIFFGWQMSANTKKVRITGVKIEKGSVATQFVRSAGTIQGELAACQRYYWRSTGSANNYYVNGLGYTTTEMLAFVQMPVSMRVAPTVLDYSNLVFRDGSSTFTFSSISINQSGTSSIVLYATGLTGVSAYRPYYLANNNTTSGYFGLGAEL